MKIEKDKFVEIHYTLTDDDGNQLDSSVGRSPLGYVQGNGMLISGLEAQLEGKEAGDKFKAVVEAKDAYGEYNQMLVGQVPRSQFDEGIDIQVGMTFQASADDGSVFLVRIIDVNDDTVTIDGNHELAGKRLTFDVEVVNVRESTDADFNMGCGGCGGNCGGGCGSCGDGSCGEGSCECGSCGQDVSAGDSNGSQA